MPRQRNEPYANRDKTPCLHECRQRDASSRRPPASSEPGARHRHPRGTSSPMIADMYVPGDSLPPREGAVVGGRRARRRPCEGRTLRLRSALAAPYIGSSSPYLAIRPSSHRCPPRTSSPVIAGMYVPGDSPLGHMGVQVPRDTSPSIRLSVCERDNASARRRLSIPRRGR